MPASLVRLKVTLDHVEPTVMRRVVVPFRNRPVVTACRLSS
nr:plasmid pRiA4b ORF-3 family protein [Ensifer aridi]